MCFPILLALSLIFLAPPTASFAVGSTPMSMSSDLAVVGCGVLGTSLCRQLLLDPEIGSRIVTGVTKTTNQHNDIRKEVGQPESKLILTTSDELKSRSGSKFKDVVFCAPPSAFDDYSGAVKEALQNVWTGPSGGGVFAFTSSGGVYEGKDGETVTEASPTMDPDKNPRTGRIVKAERICTERGGCVLRLAGLYTLERGAHNYWLDGNRDVQGREDGIVNLLHYDDAASACMAAIKAGASVVGGKTFLISDGNPTTRRGICESAMKANQYAGRAMPEFLGDADSPKGKVYDGSYSNKALNWQPTYASFDDFMSSK